MSAAAGKIGPNAILQLIDVLERRGMANLCAEVLQAAMVARPPPDAPMLPEQDCAAVHQALRRLEPDRADHVLRLSGLATGDYILANRIPPVAQSVLRLLPGRVAAPILSKAIVRHSWTFAGTGRFTVERRLPPVLVLERNPLVAGLSAKTPQCIWHAAVFEKLFSRLVWPDVTVQETACCACGDAACRFEVTPRGKIATPAM